MIVRPHTSGLGGWRRALASKAASGLAWQGGYSLRTDGVDEKAVGPALMSALPAGSSWTAIAWIKLGSGGRTQFVIGATAQAPMQLAVASSDRVYAWGQMAATSRYRSSSDVLTVGVWYQIGVVNNGPGNVIDTYINGVKNNGFSGFSGGTADPAQAITLGTSGTSYFDGNFCEVAMFPGVALTGAQMLSLAGSRRDLTAEVAALSSAGVYVPMGTSQDDATHGGQLYDLSANGHIFVPANTEAADLQAVSP